MSCDILYVKYCLQCKASDINVTTRKSSAAPACVLKCHPLARQILQLKVGLFKRPILGSQLRYDLQSGKNKFLQQQNRQQAKIVIGAVVVAQLTAQSISIQEDPGSNPVIGNFYLTYLPLTVCTKDEKRKRGRQWPIKKIFIRILISCPTENIFYR